MDIGNTLRCFTVEPLRDPVPRPTAVPGRVREPEPKFTRTLLLDDPALAGVLAPTLARRIGG